VYDTFSFTAANLPQIFITTISNLLQRANNHGWVGAVGDSSGPKQNGAEKRFIYLLEEHRTHSDQVRF